MQTHQPSHPNQPAQPKLHNKVEEQIRLYIAQHQLTAGAQLPTEAKLCIMLKVSRSTVRHALLRLELAGLINRTRGRGTFLQDPQQREQSQSSEQTNTTRSSTPATPAGGNDSLIGVVFSYANEIDVMQTALLRGVQHAVNPRGYNVLFGRTDDWDEHGEARAIADLLSIGAKGLVILPVPNRTTTIGVKQLLDDNVPFVLVDRYLSDLDTSFVVS